MEKDLLDQAVLISAIVIFEAENKLGNTLSTLHGLLRVCGFLGGFLVFV